MNLWECDEPGCKSTAVGVGGAVGLTAIGWYFERGRGGIGFLIGARSVQAVGGPTIRCPLHRPDPQPCAEAGDNAGAPCSPCRAETVAERSRLALVAAGLAEPEGGARG